MSDPKTWVPYWNTRDCSQGFCTLYCPQWCYNKIAPPPPSIESHGHDHSARPYFSPLIIAIIGILASGFILISYYAVMSKYCRNRIPSSEPNTGLELEQNPDHVSSHDQAPNAGKNGLDEDRIKSIAVFKYRKGDGVVDGSDCSVCLSEFREDDSLRLLPTCRHAFHLPCIDTWLKSHSNCPLCRANIIVSPEFSTTDDDVRETSEQQPEIPAVGDNLRRQTHMISIPDNNNNNNNQEIIRRSMSMNYAFNQGRLSVADILRIDDQDSDQFPDSQLRHTLSLSRAKFLFPMLNRGRLQTIPF